MPGPAVYIAVAIVTVAAGFTFKHFVYDPHIAPKVEIWRHEITARRDARRRRRQGPIPVAVDLNTSAHGRRSDDSGSESDDNPQANKRSYELEDMGSKDVADWRHDVDRAGTLRQRKNANKQSGSPSITSGSSTSSSPGQTSTHELLSGHVLFDSSTESPPTTPSRLSTPLTPQVSTLHGSPSQSTLRSQARGEVSTEQLVEIDPSPASPVSSTFSLTEGSDGRSQTVASSPGQAFTSPNLIPSLSLSHPVDLDREHDVELLSAPSSRPDSPFSNFSRPSSAGGFSAASGDVADPYIVSPPGISQLLPPPPPPPSAHSLQLSNSFYQTPTSTMSGSALGSSLHSELEFMSFDEEVSSDRASSPSVESVSMNGESADGSDSEGSDGSWESIGGSGSPSSPRSPRGR